MFEEKVAARKFKDYKCVRANNARVIGMQMVDHKEVANSSHVESI